MAESGPDLEKAKRQYTTAAPGYDRRMRRTSRWRGLAVDRLFLGDGETVIDVACGTGLNFKALTTAVGPRGRVVGIDASPEMVEIARRRVQDHGWQNVEVIEAPVEEADFDAIADAALFSFVHDVLQSPAAVENVIKHLREAGRVASVGAKFAGPFAFPVNAAVRLIARRYVTTFDGFDRPWRLLEPYTGELMVEPLALGGAYVAWGELRRAGQGTTWMPSIPGQRR
jgi:ubiquinone/menaquinone biosynthesis C-methylase UbiE